MSGDGWQVRDGKIKTCWGDDYHGRGPCPGCADCEWVDHEPPAKETEEVEFWDPATEETFKASIEKGAVYPGQRVPSYIQAALDKMLSEKGLDPSSAQVVDVKTVGGKINVGLSVQTVQPLNMIQMSMTVAAPVESSDSDSAFAKRMKARRGEAPPRVPVPALDDPIKIGVLEKPKIREIGEKVHLQIEKSLANVLFKTATEAELDAHAGLQPVAEAKGSDDHLFDAWRMAWAGLPKIGKPK